jgi:protein TonB
MWETGFPPREAASMRITLLESERHFLQTAECALLSIVAHSVIIGVAIGGTAGGALFPADEREARVFFLLPPDRVQAPSSQPEQIQWGRLGADVQDGRNSEIDAAGWLTHHRAQAGRRSVNELSGARGELPIGPGLPPVDTVFSVVEVDSVVQRFETSAAPVYPPELLAQGAEGVVYAQFVVDTTGRVDTTTIRLLTSPHHRFSESVRLALTDMHFRAAVRGRHKVRQLVEQHFRFTVTPPTRQFSARTPI